MKIAVKEMAEDGTLVYNISITSPNTFRIGLVFENLMVGRETLIVFGVVKVFTEFKITRLNGYKIITDCPFTYSEVSRFPRS